MTEQERQSIRERVNRATPGSWWAYEPKETRDVDSPLLRQVNTTTSGYKGHFAVSRTIFIAGDEPEEWRDNVLFIAHAREDVPRLLDEVQRLRGVLVKCLSANPSEIESIITQALGQEADPIDPRD